MPLGLHLYKRILQTIPGLDPYPSQQNPKIYSLSLRILSNPQNHELTPNMRSTINSQIPQSLNYPKSLIFSYIR